jgi:glycosyltransferase involved in cell wall biosynthesis
VVTHNTAHYIALHYMEFIESLVALGYCVQIVAPRDKAFQVLEEAGAQCHDFPLSQRGMNPLRELYSVYFLWRLLRRLNPVVVFNYSIKPVIYGSFVAGRCGVPHVYSMVTGLGYMFAKDSVLKRLVLSLYKRVLKYNEKVFFQNTHDRDEFLSHRLLEPRDAIVVNGTGIDLHKFHPVESIQETPVFLLMSRMLWEKGVEEFVVAAGALREAYPQARFQLLGPVDDNPSAIPREQLDRWQLEGVEYLGETADVRPFLERATVFVLPSYYREGRPRSTLEAMAMGKPVITTDWPGCRDPIQHGVNGYLIPVRNSNELRLAMERFLVDEDLAPKMGKQSRRIVEREYDVHEVNRQILAYFPNSGESGCYAA